MVRRGGGSSDDGWDDDDDDDGPPGKVPAGELSNAKSMALAVSSTDCLAEVERAKAFADRLDYLASVKAAAEKAELPQIGWHIDREVRKLNKSHNIGNQSPGPAAILQRFLKRRRQEDFAVLAKKRKENEEKRKSKAALKALAKKQKLAKAAAKRKDAAKKTALAKLPTTFKAGELGQGHDKGGTKCHEINRVALLNRLALRSPPLPLEWQEKMQDLFRKYSNVLARDRKSNVGTFLLGEVKEVMADLGIYLRGEKGEDLSEGKKGKGSKDVFLVYLKRIAKKVPKDPNELRI